MFTHLKNAGSSDCSGSREMHVTSLAYPGTPQLSCYLQVAGPTKAGQVVEASNTCAFPASDVLGATAKAWSAAGWDVQKVELLVGSTWEQLFVGGTTAAYWVDTDGPGTPYAQSVFWEHALPKVFLPPDTTSTSGVFRFTTGSGVGDETVESIAVEVTDTAGVVCTLTPIAPSVQGGVIVVANTCPVAMADIAYLTLTAPGVDRWGLVSVEVYETRTLSGVTAPRWMQWVARDLDQRFYIEDTTVDRVSHWYRQYEVVVKTKSPDRPQARSDAAMEIAVTSPEGYTCSGGVAYIPLTNINTAFTVLCPFPPERVSSVTVTPEYSSDDWQILTLDVISAVPTLIGYTGGQRDADVTVATTWVFGPTAAPPTPAPATLAPVTPTPTVSPPTSSPPTPSPPTPSPPTPAPPTLTPRTALPPTASPSTSSPPTPEPPVKVSTGVPTPVTTPPTDASGQPPTLASITPGALSTSDVPTVPSQAPVVSFPPEVPNNVTSASATGAPGTAYPESDTPEVGGGALSQPAPSLDDVPRRANYDENVELVQSVSVTLASLALLGSAQGGAGAMKLVIVSIPCLYGENSAKQFPLVLNLMGMSLDGSESLGALAGNTALMLGCVFLSLLLLQLAKTCGKHFFTTSSLANLDTQGFLRLPSAPLLLFQLLYQSIAYSAMNLSLQPRHPHEAVVGVVAVLLCLCVPVLTLRKVVSGMKAGFGVYATAKERTSTALVFAIGKGEWVNTNATQLFVQRYSSVMRTFARRTYWFFILEYAASFTICAIHSVEPDFIFGCGHMKAFSALILFAMMLLEATLSPHCRFRDSVVGILLNGLLCCATILMAVAYYHEDNEYWTLDAATYTFDVAVVVLMIKVAADLATELYLYCSERRTIIQEKYLADHDTHSDGADEIESDANSGDYSLHQLLTPNTMPASSPSSSTVNDSPSALPALGALGFGSARSIPTSFSDHDPSLRCLTAPHTEGGSPSMHCGNRRALLGGTENVSFRLLGSDDGGPNTPMT